VPADAQKQAQGRVDSLLAEIPKSREDTNKVTLLNSLAGSYSGINPNEGLNFGLQGLALAEKLHWKKGIAGAQYSMGVDYMSMSDYGKALELYNIALSIFEEIGYKKGIGSVTGAIGGIYIYQSDYPKTLGYYFKALKMCEETQNKHGIASITQGIGNVYLYQSEYPKALEYYFKALKMDEEVGDKDGIARLLDCIGIVYNSQADYTEALGYYFKALKMDKEVGDKRLVAEVTGSIGNVYDEGLKDYPRALEYYFNALKIYEEIGNKNGVANSTANIGNVYTCQRNYTQAVVYHFKALRMSREIGDKSIEAGIFASIGWDYLSIVTDTCKAKPIIAGEPYPMRYRPDSLMPAGNAALLHKAVEYFSQAIIIDREIGNLNSLQNDYKKLSKADSLLGDIKGAYYALSQYIVYKDSVFSQNNAVKIARLERAKRAETDSLRSAAERRVADLKYRQQLNYTYLGITGILTLLAFSVFIIKERRKSERERKKTDTLLLNILPREVAEELKATGTAAAKHFDNVTVLLTDFVNFTRTSENMKAQELIDELDVCFKMFDEIISKYNIEKIKTIGDAYLAVAGLPIADPRHAEQIINAAKEIRDFVNDRYAKLGNKTFEIRVGINTGSVVAGIVGRKKFAYDIWGDTVNTAARMEQNSVAGKINISQSTYELVKDKFDCEYRGEIDAKNKGMMKMYYVN
jgi:adenylate cyclase